MTKVRHCVICSTTYDPSVRVNMGLMGGAGIASYSDYSIQLFRELKFSQSESLLPPTRYNSIGVINTEKNYG